MIFDMPSCGGCRTCEIACSFKHKGEFVPSISSIQILDKESEPGFLVLLFEEHWGEHFICDGCKGHEVPFCMQYCQKSEDLEKILKEFLNKTQAREEES
jgi:Fe-S-cluster-containing hydrogenase component 2